MGEQIKFRKWDPKIGMEKPMRWRKQSIVSVHDLFRDAYDDESIHAAFAVMALCPQHTFLVGTKQIGLMKTYMSRQYMPGAICDTAIMTMDRNLGEPQWPLPNVWLGVPIEDQATADERVPKLLEIPAALRFVSAEPLLGPVDLTPWLGTWTGKGSGLPAPLSTALEALNDIPGIDWVICGGESGAGARPMHPDWARGLRDQCVGAQVPFFFKQWGEWITGKEAHERGIIPIEHRHPFGLCQPAMARVGKRLAGRLLDGREWSEMPGAHQIGGKDTTNG